MSPVGALPGALTRARTKVKLFRCSCLSTLRNQLVPYAICMLPKRSIWRHGDISTFPIFSAEVSGSLIPYDLDRIRLLLSRVVVPENKSSDEIDLEYQLQIVIA